MIKESTPPYISISDSYWNENKWASNGQFSDPDGEDVTFTLLVDGLITGALDVTGNSWQTPGINFELWSEGEHEVTIKGCDSSNKCSEISVFVNNTHLCEDEVEIILDKEKSEKSIPSAGILLTVLASAGALMYTRRRD